MHEEDCACVQYAHDTAKSDFKEFTQEEWAHRFEGQLVTYSVIRGSDDLPGVFPERLATNLAMTTWDAEIQIILEWVPRNMNPDITIEFRPEAEDEFFKSRPGVLAYAYFPKTSREGEIVFNDRYVWGLTEGIVDVTNPDGTISRVKQFNLIHTLVHEIGHSLGLRHSEGDSCKNCVMHWQYNGQLDLQPLDIERITQKYPKRTWMGNRYGRFKKWLARRKVRF